MKMLHEIQLARSNWMGKVSVLLVEIGFWELLYEGGSEGRTTAQLAGGKTSPYSKAGLRGPCLATPARL